MEGHVTVIRFTYMYIIVILMDICIPMRLMHTLNQYFKSGYPFLKMDIHF